MQRIDALRVMYADINDDIVVTIMGAVAAELYSLGHRKNFFYLQHAMGLASSMGLGLALSKPNKRVIVLDGDGSLLMNLGTLSTVAWHAPKNLIHICWDNQQYESSGGEPTVSTTGNIDFAGIAQSAGIQSARAVSTVAELKAAVSHALGGDGPHFIWARIEAGRAEAPPLRYDELENKYRFIRYIEETEGINILRVSMPASYQLK